MLNDIATLQNVTDSVVRLLERAPAGGLIGRGVVGQSSRSLHTGFANEERSFSVDVDGKRFWITVSCELRERA